MDFDVMTVAWFSLGIGKSIVFSIRQNFLTNIAMQSCVVVR
jgi:hypothetical protein